MVGGASRMPFLQDRFDDLLADRMLDPQLFGVDPVHVVASGLGHHESLDRLDLRYPNWQVVAELRSAAGLAHEVELYEPFAPLFKLTHDGPTSRYSQTIELPSDVNWQTVSLQDHPITRPRGETWPTRALPVVQDTDHRHRLVRQCDLERGRPAAVSGSNVTVRS